MPSFYAVISSAQPPVMDDGQTSCRLFGRGGVQEETAIARDVVIGVSLKSLRLPSDQILSTHTIHPPGLDVLDEVCGLGRDVSPSAGTASDEERGKPQALASGATIPFATRLQFESASGYGMSGYQAGEGLPVRGSITARWEDLRSGSRGSRQEP